MSEIAASVASARHDPARAGIRRQDRFFLAMSGSFLLLVVAGFAPTFTLKMLFQSPELPLYLHAHGAILTMWYLLAFVQPALVAAGRTDLHRRLGVAGVVTAVGVVAIGAVVLVSFVPRALANPAFAITDISMVFYGDAVLLLLFLGLVISAVVLRRRPASHKRLMLIASMSIVGPALGRLSRFGVLATISEVTFVLGSYAALNALIILHDLVTLRTVHRVTLIGTILFWGLLIGAIVLSGTPRALELLARLS
jgi:hypothetical protein